MELVTIIELIAAALGGGGIVSLFTIREAKKGAKIENQTKEDDRGHTYCDELQEQITKLNERLEKKDNRITELEDVNTQLHIKLDEANTSLAKATLLKCTRLGCDKRKPPLGYLELTPEELMIAKSEEE